MTRKLLLAASAVAIVATAASVAVAKPTQLKGSIGVDGSSTVGPYIIAAAEAFQKLNKNVRITVGISGTGGGFERFCKGETDMSNASRPIKQGPGSEADKCKTAGIRYVAFAVANDGISIVVNKENTWARCITTAELKQIWNTGSKVDNWNDVRPGFPDVGMKLFGPGTDSGTFDFFTEHINGKSKASRSDYQASEDDNVLVQGVSGEKGGLGYFGLSYYEENKDKLSVLQVDGGKGCVTPTAATVQNRTYPIARPIFTYIKLEAFKRPEVQGFINYILNNEVAIAKSAAYVSLTPAQLKNAKRQFKNAVAFAKKNA
jgi:phosphate transport system substrate-binding protein